MTGRALPPDPPREALAALAGLDRRGFLRLAGAAAAAGLLPLGCNGVPPELAPPAELELEVFAPRSYAVFNAAAARIVGPRGAALIRAGAADPARIADAWLARLPHFAGPLEQALWVLEFGVPPLLRKLRPFTRLGGAAQDRVLEDLMRSPLELKRALFKGVKSFACLAFYAAPASRAVTGYPGPFGAGTVSIGDAMRYEVES